MEDLCQGQVIRGANAIVPFVVSLTLGCALRTYQDSFHSSSYGSFNLIKNCLKTMTNDNDQQQEKVFEFSASTIIYSIFLFILAGVAEILGGWCVWVSIRSDKPWYFALIGSLVLVLYGFIPVLQPMDEFGRIYAVYGGFFIVMSFLLGWALDGNRPDIGDLVGGGIALVGVIVIMLWPR